MTEQSKVSTRIQGYWYALIAAAPMPETGEAVNVGVVFGNGRACQLRYIERLPRLCGIAALDEINVYEAVLAGVANEVERGVPLDIVASMLAPQMIVRSPRALLREPSEELIDRIVKQYLAEPLQPTRRINIDALIHRSLVKLDREIEATRVRGVLIYKQVRPKNFYEGKLDRYVPFTVPPISRALRGVNGRDVLLDSLVVEEGVDPVALRSAVTRISQAFWAYDEKLGDLIKTRANREIRTVGILQPIEGETTQNLLTTRDFIRETWSHHADVITGNQEDIRARLREHMGWVAAELV